MNIVSQVKLDLTILNNPNRDFMVDNLRALAILMVVFHHFNIQFFKVGFLGVDVFFVLSGYLVSKALLTEVKKKGNISFKTFYVKRFFKIIPSYYFFIFWASIFMYFYSSSQNIETKEITLESLPYYLLLIQNYTGYTAFYHVWSLCVEEHFYIFLPIAIYTIIKIFSSTKALILALILVVLLGNLARVIGYYKGFDTYAATHNRVDALAFGVLLAIIKTSDLHKSFSKNTINLIAFVGVLLFFLTLYLSHFSKGGELFQDIFSHTLMPISIFFILLFSFSFPEKFNFKTLKFISFYSYNWYLWHFIFVTPFHLYLGKSNFVLFTYIVFTFLIAFLITHFFEIPILKKRVKFFSS